MIPPNGPELLRSIASLDPEPDVIESLLGCDRFMDEMSKPVCRDCAELSEALREYEQRDEVRLKRIDRLKLRNESLCGCLMLAGLAIAGLLVWVVTR